MLSVLIPKYNYQVSDLVETLYKQARKANITLEIVIADDASTEHVSENIHLRQFAGTRVFEFSQNKGRTFTRNFLATHAQFSNLLFLDADVIPTHKDFLSIYLNNMPSQNQIVLGGCNYQNYYLPDESLRWNYGKNRESIPAVKRRLHPYKYILSGNFLIHKSTFFDLGMPTCNQYGMDLIFAKALQEKAIEIIHIDNTIDHLGLESNEVFLKKSQQAITLRFQHRAWLNTPYEKIYQRAKKLKLDKVITSTISLFQQSIKKNLLSTKPSLFLFDLHRLAYYISLHHQRSLEPKNSSPS